MSGPEFGNLNWNDSHNRKCTWYVGELINLVTNTT